MTPTRILIADVHQVVRLGLLSLLEGHTDVVCVGEAATAAEVLAGVREHTPSLLTLDFNLPDRSGLELVPQLKTLSPSTRVLVFTMHSDQETMRRALAVGVHGFLSKEAAPDEVLSAIRTVAAGRIFVSVPNRPDTHSLAPRPSMSASSRPLSERERQVLQLFARGMTHREVAAQLSVRLKTIETYRSRLGDKFGARTRQELIQHARSMGLVESTPQSTGT